KLYLMGGYFGWDFTCGVYWNNEDDYNLQLDVRSAMHVFQHSHPTLITLPMTAQTWLRRKDVPRLAQAGDLGKLLARQAEYCAEHERIGERFANQPCIYVDMINFLHDPLACAIALGWNDGVKIETMPIRSYEQEGYIYQVRKSGDRPVNVVRSVDGDAFSEF